MHVYVIKYNIRVNHKHCRNLFLLFNYLYLFIYLFTYLFLFIIIIQCVRWGESSFQVPVALLIHSVAIQVFFYYYPYQQSNHLECRLVAQNVLCFHISFFHFLLYRLPLRKDRFCHLSWPVIFQFIVCCNVLICFKEKYIYIYIFH